MASSMGDNPTLADIMETIHKCSEGTNMKIDNSIIDIKHEIHAIKRATDENTAKMTEMEKDIEVLRQSQVKSNIKISGVPKLNFDPMEFVFNLCNLLEVVILEEEFEAYRTKNGNFVIVNFDSYKKKQQLLRKASAKKSIMAEEIFENTTSNSQLYINDQLTPYFSKLFQMAHKAKKDKKNSSSII